MRKLLLFVFLPSVLMADGVIIPIPPHPTPEPIYLDLDYHKVHARIEENVAVVTIEEVFSNPHPQSLEGQFIFPIPDQAVISGFALWVGDEKVEGEVLDRDEARRIYEDIVMRRRDPALLEYYDRDLFRTRIFPIPPKGERKISIEYEQVLRQRGEFVEFRYPLKIEALTNSPIDDLVIELQITTAVPMKTIFSPSHDIDVVMEKENEASVTYEGSNITPLQDMLLYFSSSEEEFGFSSLMHRTKDEGFFILSVAPGTEVEEVREEKDIVFVLDVSGSMAADGKINAAKKSLNFFLSSLDEEDRFTVIPFSTDVNPWQDGLAVAEKDAVQDAMEFVSGFRAIGGTNIAGALSTALSLERTAGRPFYVAFITDGKPTVGETGTEQILKLVEEGLDGAKVFSLGVGYEVNTHLIDRIAQTSRALSDYARPGEDLEFLLSDFYSKFTHPALIDISIDYGEAGVHQAYPQTLPDLFYGSEIVIFGRYRYPGTHCIILRGTRGGEEEVLEYEVDLPEADDHPFLPRLWAKRRVGYLLDEIRLHGEETELVDEIVELGTEYGIVTPYTSYLVAEEDMAEAREHIIAPSEMKLQTGRAAVKVARDIAIYKDGTQLLSEGEKALPIKVIDEKVFIKKDGVWVDSEYDEEMEERVLVLWSDEFMNFFRDHAEIGKYVSLGGEVVFVYKGTAYRITS
jgi:Ca-activated chloride channel family protein